ncbi:MAG: hypothetical protein SGJ09_03620 [Phycisphaerae bacterium]|nr:hypothetical protein [Phycisphaerae bacterium]
MPLPLARLIASSLALVAFAVAVVVGLEVGNPADAILLRALGAMLACFIGGYGVGLVCEQIVRGHLRKIDAMNLMEQPEEPQSQDELRSASTISRERAPV